MVIHPDNPPSNMRYDAGTDTWFLSYRPMNVSHLERTGIDLELQYGWSIGNNLFNCRWRRSHTSTYDFILDPATAADKPNRIRRSEYEHAQDQASLLPLPIFNIFPSIFAEFQRYSGFWKNVLSVYQ